MVRKKIYYAHCMAIYNTPQENRDVETLEDLGFIVYNPNNPVDNARCSEIRHNFVPPSEQPRSGIFYSTASDEIMGEVFKPAVEGCDALAFRALPDGRIPAGVFKEIQWAREAGIPRIELPSGVGSRSMSIDATREYLTEMGQR
jgi:hypothetical protein